MKKNLPVMIALGPFLLLSPSPGNGAAVTGQIQARLTLSAACQINNGSEGQDPSMGTLGVLDFGSQGPTWDRSLKAGLEGDDGRLDITCNSSVKGFTVTIDGGAHGDGTSRRLSNGRQLIPYRLTLDPGGSNTYSIGQQQRFAVGNGEPVAIPVYGSLVANTNALPAGVYSDTLTITLDW